MLRQVWVCAAIASGSPASQSSASASGRTCSISQAMPYCSSEPNGSATNPSTSMLAEAPATENSTQLRSWTAPRTDSTSSASQMPAHGLTGASTVGATSGLVMVPKRPRDGPGSLPEKAATSWPYSETPAKHPLVSVGPSPGKVSSRVTAYIDRRSLLRGGAAVGLLGATSALLAACGGDNDKP